MAAAYKLLNEYHTGQKGGNNQVYQSTQLVFAQKTLKCFKCGTLGYTVRNYPNCSKGSGGFKPKDQKYKKPPKLDKPNNEKKLFAKVKEKPKPLEKSAELGFVQMTSVSRDPVVEYSFVNICKVDSPSKMPLKKEHEPDDLPEAEYTQSDSNIIGGTSVIILLQA